MESIQTIYTLDDFEVQLCTTGKVNGPNQPPGGLSFGTSYLFYKHDKLDWTKIDLRSQHKVKILIENSYLYQLKELLE